MAQSELSKAKGNLTRAINSAKMVLEKYYELSKIDEVRSKYGKDWEFINSLLSDFGAWIDKFYEPYNVLMEKIKELKGTQRKLKANPTNKDLMKKIAELTNEILKGFNNLNETIDTLKERCRELNKAYKQLDSKMKGAETVVPTTPKPNLPSNPDPTNEPPTNNPPTDEPPTDEAHRALPIPSKEHATEQSTETAVAPGQETPEDQPMETGIIPGDNVATEDDKDTTEDSDKKDDSATEQQLPSTEEAPETDMAETQTPAGQPGNPQDSPIPTLQESQESEATTTPETEDKVSDEPEKPAEDGSKKEDKGADKGKSTSKDGANPGKSGEKKSVPLKGLSLSFPIFILCCSFLIAGIFMPFAFIGLIISGLFNIAVGTGAIAEYTLTEKAPKGPKLLKKKPKFLKEKHKSSEQTNETTSEKGKDEHTEQKVEEATKPEGITPETEKPQGPEVDVEIGDVAETTQAEPTPEENPPKADEEEGLGVEAFNEPLDVGSETPQGETAPEENPPKADEEEGLGVEAFNEPLDVGPRTPEEDTPADEHMPTTPQDEPIQEEHPSTPEQNQDNPDDVEFVEPPTYIYDTDGTRIDIEYRDADGNVIVPHTAKEETTTDGNREDGNGESRTDSNKNKPKQDKNDEMQM